MSSQKTISTTIISFSSSNCRCGPCGRKSRDRGKSIFSPRGTLATSHIDELKPLGDLFARAQAAATARAEWMGRGASPLLYYLLNAGVDYCFPSVQRIDRDIRRIEERLFGDDTRHGLHEIAVIRRGLIALRPILGPQLEVIRELKRSTWPFIREDLDLYWGDISDHLSQLCSMLEEHIDVVSGQSGTVERLASHRTHEAVRPLTIVTVLTPALSPLSTIFSMNVRQPYGRHPPFIFAVAEVGRAITIGLVCYLRQRKWL